MKKFAILLLSVVLIVASVALVACKVDQDTCDHKWGEWVETTAATCAAEGEQTRTCSVCKKQETQKIDALEHKVLDATTGALKFCKDVDLTAGANCSLCNELLTGDTLKAALDHRTVRTVSALDPTCTKTGLTEGKKCATCNFVTVEQEVVEALGHTPVDVAATVATCTVPAYSAGTQCSRCKEYLSGHEAVTPATGHDFSDGDYFTYIECANGCGSYGRLTGGNPFETEFIYDFDAAAQQTIDIVYEELVNALKIESPTEEQISALFDLFEEYDGWVGYVQAQYQFSRILNDIAYDTSSKKEFAKLAEYYNTTIARYYSVFKAVDESAYKTRFWAWTEWDADYIAYVLSLANSYDVDNRNAVDEIIDAYYDLLDTMKGTEAEYLQLFQLYSQLVAANNNIAVAAGEANYMDYAYKNVYERDYTPEEVATMRRLVKENIGPLLADVATAYYAWDGWTSRASQLFYSQFASDYLFRDPNSYLQDSERLGMILDSRESIVDYFKFLNGDDNQVDFYGALNNLFETGNIFMGNNTNITAYTWYVYSTGTPILVFGGAKNSGVYTYRDAFTFVHEFGHYYQFAHNDLLSVPMDHDETQSQGDEMLFLAWLHANLASGLEEGFELLELSKLFDMLGSIVMSTAVDEFEYLAYTGAETFNGQPIPTVEGTDVIDYASLYALVMESYWEGITEYFNTKYWMYVAFDNAAYYISYAMSALPCIELYAKAGNEGIEAARESYLKLFTFSSNDEFLAEDDFGDKYVTATYAEILNWAGLSDPFDEELYVSIKTFFESR